MPKDVFLKGPLVAQLTSSCPPLLIGRKAEKKSSCKSSTLTTYPQQGIYYLRQWPTHKLFISPSTDSPSFDFPMSHASCSYIFLFLSCLSCPKKKTFQVDCAGTLRLSSSGDSFFLSFVNCPLLGFLQGNRLEKSAVAPSVLQGAPTIFFHKSHPEPLSSAALVRHSRLCS